MKAEGWLVGPVLVVAGTLGRASGAPMLAAVVAALAAVLAAVGPRWELDRGRQIVASTIGVGVGYTLVSLLYEQEPGVLSEGWTRLCACALLGAAARFVQVRPAGGATVTVLMLFLAELAAGEVRRAGESRLVYPIAAVLFLATSLAALRAADVGRPRLGGRALGVGALVVALSVGLGGLAVGSVRAAQAWLMRRAQSRGTYGWQAQTGFSDQMSLGALGGLLDSDTVVLRVRGRPTDYLRGAVFDVYEVGRWRRSVELARESEATWEPAAPSGESTEIQSTSERTDRFFLPLHARAIEPAPQPIKLDAFGILKRTEPGVELRVRFVEGERDQALVEPPTTHDLYLPSRLRQRLAPVLRTWLPEGSSPAERLTAIEQHLTTEFRYSRDFQRDRGLDPVLDFVLNDRSGHCEYFASAMVLLARGAGVPARVVTGYRVAERSPFESLRVVRERNAHAWVEAWVEGQGWTTHDPTPGVELPQNQPHETPFGAALLDLVRLRFEQFTTWLGRRSLLQITLASLVGLAVLTWVVARGVRKNSRPAAPVAPDALALPFLRALLDALAARGHRHDDHEPLATFAHRLPYPEVGELLLRYEDLRYGGHGDGESLAAAMDACTRRLRSPALPRS